MTRITPTFNPGDPADGVATTIDIDVRATEAVERLYRTDVNGTSVVVTDLLPFTPTASDYVIARQNLVINPNLKNAVTGWESTSAAGDGGFREPDNDSGSGWAFRVGSDGSAGAANMLCGAAVAVSPGDIITAGVMLLGTEAIGSITPRILWSNGTYTSGASKPLLPNLDPDVYSVSTVVPAGVTSARIAPLYNMPAAGAAIRGFKAIIAKGWAGDYFDGDTTGVPGRVYAWSGTPHASYSVERAPLPRVVKDSQAANGYVAYDLRTPSFVRAAAASVQNTITKPWLVLTHLPDSGTSFELMTAYSATRSSQSTVHQIIDAEFPVVNIGPLGAPRGVVELYCESFKKLRDLEYYLNEGVVVMLRQTVEGLDFYFVPLRTTRTPYSVEGETKTRWRLTVEYTEVYEPGQP